MMRRRPAPPTRIRTIVPLLALTGVLLVGVGLSAQLRYRPTETGPWRPWSFTAIASARSARGATAAEVAAFQSRLQGLGEIVRRAPAVAQPVGFAAELWGHLAGHPPPPPGQPAGRDVPLAGALSFGAFPLIEFMRGDRLVNEDMKGGETELLQFTVNQIDGRVFSAGTPSEWSGADVAGFIEPHAAESVAGYPRFGDVVVIRKNPQPLWLPLPLDEALQPVAALRRAEFEQRRDTYAKHAAEFVTWQTPAARAARRASWQQAAASMPDGAQFLTELEASDREIEEANRERLAPGGPADRLAVRFRVLEGAPATCRPLVTPNWTYFDATLPRAAPQVVMLTGFSRCLTRESQTSSTRGGCVINRALVESMDWDAVLAWLGR